MRKILSILVALFFLATSSGISWGTHYCGGKVHKRSLLFVHNDLNCGMDNMDNNVPCSNSGTTLKKNCCENDIQTVKIEDEYQGSLLELKLDNSFAVALLVTSLKLFSSEKTGIAKYRYYKPPKLNKNILVLVQSFLL